MEFGSFMMVYSLLLGLVLGSFLNVCIHRIPLKRSIVSPPSSCPKCGHRIRFYDNIPLISYFLLLGKCRHCRQSVPWQYPAVEAMTGLLSLSLFIIYGLSFQYALYFLFAAVLVTISFIDLHHRIIPDFLSLPGIAVGFAASFVLDNVTWLDSLIGILAGGGILYLVAFVYETITGREGMGGGDIKLLAMIGAWLGWRPIPIVLLISSLLGALIGLAFIIVTKKGYRARIPFGPFLSLGALICLFLGHELSRWYPHLLL